MADLRDLAYRISYTVNESGLNAADSAVENIGDGINQSNNNLNRFNRNADGTSSIFGKLATLAAGAFAVDKIKDFGQASITAFANFEQAMSNVQATIGATDNAMLELEKAAKEAGKTTKFSATESANALNYMALAGFDATESVEALPSVLNLAAAGNIDLATTSDLVTDSMSALGLQVTDLDTFTDKLARTSQKSNTNIQQLGEGILTVGGVAKNAGLSVTDMSAQLGILADNGKKGAEGGTALRNVILSLTAPNNKVTDLLEDLNVETTDAQGNFLNFNDILLDLKDNLAGYSEGQRQSILRTIAGKENIQALNILLEGSGARYEELTKQINDSNNAAKEMADVQMDNLSGAFTTFKSALEGTMIDIVDNSEASEEMREVLQDLTEQLPKLQQVATVAFSGFSKAVRFLTDNMNILLPVTSGLLTGLLAFKAISGITALWHAYKASVFATTVAQSGLNAALMANPFGLAAAAIGALVAAGVALWANWDWVTEKAQMMSDAIVKAFDAFVGFAGRKLNQLKTWFDATFGDLIVIAVEELKPIVGAVGEIFDDMVQFGSEKIGMLFSAFESLGEGVANIFKGIANTFVDMMNFVIDGMNNISFSTPDWIPGIGGKSFGVDIDRIPKFATGTESTPDTFIAGEEGPELITNAPNMKVFTAPETQQILNPSPIMQTNSETFNREIINNTTSNNTRFETFREMTKENNTREVNNTESNTIREINNTKEIMQTGESSNTQIVVNNNFTIVADDNDFGYKVRDVIEEVFEEIQLRYQ